jgi:glycosyltransferase involved in cell wall biosynthesis
MPEAISDSVSGYIVPPANPEALATRICEVLLDKRHAAEMGQRAYQVLMEKFTEDIMVRKTEILYDRFVNERLL